MLLNVVKGAYNYQLIIITNIKTYPYIVDPSGPKTKKQTRM